MDGSDAVLAVVLLVEDEPAVRAVAGRVLERAGYRVLEAADAEEALAVSRRYDGGIDLLLCDVVLPSLGGPELAARLAEQRPGMRLLFTSGYSVEDVRRRIGGGVPDRPPLLVKPFTPQELLERVQGALSAGGDGA